MENFSHFLSFLRFGAGLPGALVLFSIFCTNQALWEFWTEQLQIKVNNLYFAAPFYGLIGIQAFDDVNKTFFSYDNISCVKKYFNKAFCLYSDNDPYVPASMSKEISAQLNASVQIISGGGHLNASAGIIQFKQLKELIDKNG